MHRQRGVAMLLAVLIVVIATTVAVNVAHEEKFTIRKTAHMHLSDRADVFARGLEDYGRLILKEDREESETDSLDESWSSGIPGAPIEGGYMTGYMEDEQAKFNLNTVIVSDIALARFRRLCENLGVDDRFIPALQDWIDPDFDVRYPDGAEENYDTYRVANRDMVDISELRLVRYVTPEIYDMLEPHITALPPPTTINVNTMSPVILQSLTDEVDITRFTEEREDQIFESVEDFVARLQLPVETEGLSVGSNYFRARGQIIQGEQLYNLSTLILRNDAGKTTILSRTLGQF